jgi:hypothetical protein
VAGHKLRVAEVPSIESERIHGVSNLNAFTDGNRVLRTIVQEWRRLRKEPAPKLPVVVPAQADPQAEQPGYVPASVLPPGVIITTTSVVVSGER